MNAPSGADLLQHREMHLTLRAKAQTILREAGWDLAPPPVIWSPRMARCAGLFVIEKGSRGKWHPEIRLSIPLLRRRDWPWPQPVCGMNCYDPEQVQRRILEHEVILNKRGVPLPTIQKLMRHSNIETTVIYIETREEEMREAINLVG